MVSWGELFSTFLVRKIMRVEGTCRSANGGGSLFAGSPNILTPFCPLCLHLLPALSLPSLMLPAFLPSIVANFQTIRAKQGKMNFSLVCFGVFSGIWETARSEILIYFWKQGRKTGAEVVGCLPFGVPTGCRWSGGSCYFADVSKIGQYPAGRSAFCPLYRFVPGALPTNMAYFAFLRGFHRVLGCLCGFVLVACFSWLVGLLCA